MSNERIYDPVKDYNSKFKNEYLELTKDYLETKIKEAGVDEELNKKVCEKYYELSENHEEETSKKGRLNFFYISSIIVAIIAIIVLFVQVYNTTKGNVGTSQIVSFVVCPLLGVGLLLLAFLVLKKKIKEKNEVLEKLNKELDDLKTQAFQSLKDLKARFDYDIPVRLINKLDTVINLDSNFDSRKANFLNFKYGMRVNNPKNESSVFVRSGMINQNPFLVYRNKVQSMYDKTYTGTRVVVVTYTYTDSKGNTRTGTKNETLVAHVRKPAPCYSNETYLVYGNENAPNLSFSRFPQEINSIKDEKDYQKAAAKAFKKLKKLAEDEMMAGKKNPFTPLQNDDFEASFGCTNRDNEREFRLLFTPVAQLSMENLLRNSPYGDDFNFTKKKTLNMIASRHIRNTDLNNSNSIYAAMFDLEKIKKLFIEINTKYFESFFFLLAPLLAIPCYQNDPPDEYIYDKEYLSNFSNFEIETMANQFNEDIFLAPESKTEGILKVSSVSKDGDIDFASITAHSFTTIERVDLVPVTSSDGKVYDVAVKWDEYIPVSKETPLVLKNNNTSRFDYYYNQNDSLKNFKNYLTKNRTSSNSLVYDGILAFIGGNPNLDKDALKDIDK